MALTVQEQINRLGDLISEIRLSSPIKSIQTITGVPYTSTSVTAYQDFTINPVDTERSVIIFNSTIGASAAANISVVATFLNSTTVRLRQYGTSGNTFTVSVTILEFL